MSIIDNYIPETSPEHGPVTIDTLHREARSKLDMAVTLAMSRAPAPVQEREWRALLDTIVRLRRRTA